MTLVRFAGIVDSSTLDYIGHLCAVVYLCGCSFRCPWCQNRDLVFDKEACRDVELEEIIKQLKSNYLIEAVCISGGEPLLQEATLELLRSIKAETFLKLKIDTNGFFPDRLKKALEYLDFLTMDIKAPLGDSYPTVVGLSGNGELAARTKKSLDLVKKWGKDAEARTTIVPGLIDKKKDIAEIAKTAAGSGFKYYTLQQFMARNTLDPAYMKVKSPRLELMRELGEAAKKAAPNLVVRIVTQQRGIQEI